MSKLSIIKEFWVFLKVRKKVWLMPIIVILLSLGIMLILGETVFAPFIYTLF